MFEESFLSILSWFSTYQLNVILSIIVIITYFIFRRIVNPKIEAYTERDHLKNDTFKHAIFSLSLLSGIIAFIIILFIWGFDFKGLLALSTGLVALTGVALFANWSVLSNVTAFFILLAHQSFKRGNFVRIIELDNYVEGYISEINLFNTRLITEQRETIVFPNNLLIARPTIINPKDRFHTVGKTDDFKTEKK